jgi:hypothetical protein
MEVREKAQGTRYKAQGRTKKQKTRNKEISKEISNIKS